MDTVSITGLVATTPRHTVVSTGEEILSFRLASTQRRFDENEVAWVDSDTNWYTVVCTGRLASNASNSLEKGNRIVVTGTLKLREWSVGEDRSGQIAEIEASTLGHDLNWGTAKFKRVSIPKADLRAV